MPYMGWVITTKADSRLVGLCEVSSDDEGTECEVGYFLCPARWRQGFTTEAARAAVRYAFEHTTWDHLVGTVAPLNVASVRVLDHLGFVREKEMSSQDYVLWSLLCSVIHRSSRLSGQYRPWRSTRYSAISSCLATRSIGSRRPGHLAAQVVGATRHPMYGERGHWCTLGGLYASGNGARRRRILPR